MLEFENDKVKLERVGYAHSYTLDEVNNMFRLVTKLKQNGDFDVSCVVSGELRERFAKSIAELIVADWDRLVFDDIFHRSEVDGDFTLSASMYIVRKKEE